MSAGEGGGGLGPAGCWITHKGLETWARMAKERSFLKGGGPQQDHHTHAQEFNVAKEQHTVQPVRTVASHAVNSEMMRTPHDSSPVLTHQSRSYPGGQPRLARTPSVSSQGSLDSGSHRGSSPQIRTFAPDGRGVHQELGGATGGVSRSPSPGSSCHRAASLDIRCSSPCGSMGEMRTSSPSQSSLASLCNSPVPPGSPRGAAIGRCLSPLLIPPAATRSLMSDPTGPPASPLGALQPDLYQRRDGPLFLTSRRSGSTFGRLHLRLSYDFDRSDLHVHLIEAHNLTGSDQGGFNDPYVRLSLSSPVDNRKRQTAIHRNDPNPFFDEHFKFPVSHEDLQDKSLILQVFDYDRFSRNDVVGEVTISMEELDVSSNVEIWGEITKNKKITWDQISRARRGLSDMCGTLLGLSQTLGSKRIGGTRKLFLERP
uniref:C2 domain-containing protein n=1 Tax=Timema douglasi TaxID=61478 RepID=A0A7R8VRB2_TIMDO|nr:unnamed protein product [Timema douglasi]